MIASVRKKMILGLINEKKAISIPSLAEVAGVSESTVRRDLQKLETEGLLKRVRGAAVALEAQELHHSLTARAEVNAEQKWRIGVAAAKLISDGDTVLFDSSSTVMAVVRNLDPDIRIVAVTNDLLIALELERKPNVSTLLLGGSLRRGYHYLTGAFTEDNLRSVHVDKLFLGAGGISAERGIANYNLEAIKTRKTMVDVSDRVVVVADSTKFGKAAFSTLVPLTEVDQIVSDSGVEGRHRDMCKAHSVELTLC